MISILLRFLLIFALWWAALWFALPADWLQGVPLSLVLVHLAPPLSIAGAWMLFKRAWAWRAGRAEQVAASKEAAEHKNKQDAAQTAQQKTLAYRRAFLECRGVWAAVLETPDWHEEGKPEQVLFIEQEAKDLRGIGRASASILSLQQVFAAAWAQCETCAWLPLILVANDPGQVGWIGQAWEEATESIERRPEQPNYRSLPGSGSLADRLITLFENDPDLPAALLLGIDSPLGNAQGADSGPRTNASGHAVLAILVSRPGLSVPDGIEPDNESDADDPMTPYWERNTHREEDSLWGRIPLSLRRALLSGAPLAVLHRPATMERPPEMKRSARVQCIRNAIDEAFVNAASTEEAEPGWLVHDSNDAASFSALSAALNACGYELEPITEASNIQEQFGDVGAAREVLMLAVALIRAAQLKKPVLLAESEKGGIALGVSKAMSLVTTARVS